ncbi:MAG: patatin-like phospholipase family protein [bacterium]
MKRAFLCLLLFTAVSARPVRIGLALSGGAALGLAHIGVLKVLEEEGIGFVGITGNSMGSLVGGVYAAGYSAAQIESIALHANWSRLFSSQPSFGAQYLPERQQGQRYIVRLPQKWFVPYLPGGLVPLHNVEFLLNRLLGEIEFNAGYDFDSLPIPYRAVAVDWKAGERVILRQGRLEQAIRASIAIPGVFSPEVICGVELVDGGVMDYLPVEPVLEFKPDFVIAVLTMRRSEEQGVTSLIDVASRSLDLMGYNRIKEEKKLADLVIEPNVSKFLHSDFARAKDLIAAGESAARAALPLIKDKLQGRDVVVTRRSVKVKRLPVVKDVRFDGLKRTQASLLRREVRTRQGEILDFNTLFSDLERLFNTSLFEDVNYQLDFTGSDSVVVVFELNERAYGFYSFGLRYDSYDNVVVGVEFGEENLLGLGAMLRAAGVLGNPNEFRLGLIGTKVFNLPFGYRLDLSSGKKSLNWWQEGAFFSSYFVSYSGGIGEASYILGQNGFFNLGVQGKWLSYNGQTVDTLKPEFIAGPVFNMQVNNQDDIYLPWRGLAYSLNMFYSFPTLKSNREYLRVEVNGEQMVPIFSFLSLRLYGGLGFALGKMVFADYFRNQSELTGFAPDEFTNERQLYLGSGLRFKLFDFGRQGSYPLYLELLGDGASFSSPETLIRLRREIIEMLHWGVGFGVLVNTPLGPGKIVIGLGNFLKKTPHPGGVRIFIALGKEFRYQR